MSLEVPSMETHQIPPKKDKKELDVVKTTTSDRQRLFKNKVASVQEVKSNLSSKINTCIIFMVGAAALLGIITVGTNLTYDRDSDQNLITGMNYGQSSTASVTTQNFSIENDEQPVNPDDPTDPSNPEPAPPGVPGQPDLTIDSSEVFEKLSTCQANYEYNGAVTSVQVYNGQNIPLYSGIPAGWGWTSESNVNVWHYTKTRESYVRNFGTLIGMTDIRELKSSFNMFKREAYVGDVSGVKCVGLCCTAAMLNCGFTNPDVHGANDVYAGDSRNKQGVIVLQSTTDNLYYYLPFVIVDAKAHTWPGGAIQTQCSRYSNFSAVYNASTDACTDYGNRFLHDTNGHLAAIQGRVAVELEVSYASNCEPLQGKFNIIDVLLKIS